MKPLYEVGIRKRHALPFLFLSVICIFYTLPAHAQTMPNFGALSLENKKTVVPSYCHALFGPEKIPEKYTKPINAFSDVHEVLISALCSGRESVLLSVGNGVQTQYIYKYGYRKVDGAWKKFTYSGSKTIGNWIVGKATAQIEGVPEGVVGEVSAYVCNKVGASWKCGCSDKECTTHKWFYQTYELSKDMYKEMQSFDPYAVPQKYLDLDKPGLDIYYASKNMGYVGAKVQLVGTEFAKTAKNDITWNGQVKEKGLVSPDGTSLSITIPNLPPAKYEVRVRVGTVNSEYSIFVWIKKPGQVVVPKITSISPKIGKQGDTYTVYGEGFTNNNDVVTTFGILNGIASKDGKSITFKYDPFPEKLEAWQNGEVRFRYKQPVAVKIENTSGVSNVDTFNLDI